MWTINLPIFIQVSKNNRFYLNLNQYRNEHHQTLNKAKILFKQQVTPLLKDVPVLEGCTLRYTYFAPTRRQADVANICSIVDKFFSDALVEAGRLSDDNCSVVPMVVYLFGGVDKGHPRVEVSIEPTGSVGVLTADTSVSVQLSERPMQIKLVQTEIEQAITDYVGAMLSVKDGMRIDIALSATRGDDGFIANINIVPSTSPRALNVHQHQDAPSQAQTQVAEPAPRVTAPAPEPEAEVVAEKPARQPRGLGIKAAAAAPAPEPEPVVQQEEVQAVDEDQPAIRETPEDRQDPDQVEAQDRDLGVEGGAPLARSSIFANVKRPVNAKSEPAEADA